MPDVTRRVLLGSTPVRHSVEMTFLSSLMGLTTILSEVGRLPGTRRRSARPAGLHSLARGAPVRRGALQARSLESRVRAGGSGLARQKRRTRHCYLQFRRLASRLHVVGERLRQDSNLLPPASKKIFTPIQTLLTASKALFSFQTTGQGVERMDALDAARRLGVSP